MDCSPQGRGSEKRHSPLCEMHADKQQAACDDDQLRNAYTAEVIASATIQSRFVCDPLAKPVALDISVTKKSRTSYCQSNADTERNPAGVRRASRRGGWRGGGELARWREADWGLMAVASGGGGLSHRGSFFCQDLGLRFEDAPAARYRAQLT